MVQGLGQLVRVRSGDGDQKAASSLGIKQNRPDFVRNLGIEFNYTLGEITIGFQAAGAAPERPDPRQKRFGERGRLPPRDSWL